MSYRKKLIEVALPLDAINEASAREKSIRHGHPSTLHLWWARRPLAAARAVLFAQLVDDPSAHPELFPTEAAQNEERERLFRLIEELVLWENTNNETVLNAARKEIRKSWVLTCKETGEDPEKLPAFHDPFAGGGSIPLEAQRLGLEAYASDLNPVAVLINKAMIEIPPKFAGRPPVNPESRKNDKGLEIWRGAQGLAEDVRYYGQWMRDEAEKRIGYLYPKVKVTAEMVQKRPDLKPLKGKELTVIAWLWARTVKSPNPAFSNVDVPLVKSFKLSTKKGKEVWVNPLIKNGDYCFEVRLDKFDLKQDGTVNRSGGRCIMSDTVIPFTYIREEGIAGRIGKKLMAIVCEGIRGRIYLSPDSENNRIANLAAPNWKPEIETFGKCRVNIGLYGMTSWDKLFTPRQLLALSIFSDLVLEARDRFIADTKSADMPDDGKGLSDGGNQATAYGDALAVYLAFAIDRGADAWSSLASWRSQVEATRSTFARQALAMVWDFAEANPFSCSCGNWAGAAIDWICKVIEKLPINMNGGSAVQLDATKQELSLNKIISTDPPYYDNIGYADLSDFFYVWIRKNLRSVYPDLLATMTVPKSEELVATPYRHGDKNAAEKFFLDGMGTAIGKIFNQIDSLFPTTIYYAFKQSESTASGTASTGWETFLNALISNGFSITGTWPLRTERNGRTISVGSNALASSIVLVCRKLSSNAKMTTRRDFQNRLREELPSALRHLQKGNIAPVDLAQSAIGPGMAIFSEYIKVIEADGNPMPVRTALALINEVLDEILTEQEGELGPESRWAVAWYEQFGTGEGAFGIAETLCKAKNTSVQGLVDAGLVYSKNGRIHLLRRDELDPAWDPETDKRLTIWEATQHLIRILEKDGETAAAALLGKLRSVSEQAKDLAYRLYLSCERKGWADEARAYNNLVISWPVLTRLASEQKDKKSGQQELF